MSKVITFESSNWLIRLEIIVKLIAQKHLFLLQIKSKNSFKLCTPKIRFEMANVEINNPKKV
jgi:hypothetical protein